MSNKINIFHLLSRRYPASQYALMREVRDKAGFSASRSADYVVMGLWPSHGLRLQGIELKSYRSDWLNELKHPQKELSTLKKAIAEFEQASGINFTYRNWSDSSEKVGNAVRQYLKNGTEGLMDDLKRMEGHAKNICDNISKNIKSLELVPDNENQPTA